MSESKPPSLFNANKKNSDEINKRLMKSITIKKDLVDQDDHSNGYVSKKKSTKKEDQRKFNQRPALPADEGFFSVSDKQARISSYLKILVQLVGELSLVEPHQLSITKEEKWNFNSDESIPKIATSFNGLLVQVLENFISSKSEREQEIFLTALKKEIDKEREH